MSQPHPEVVSAIFKLAGMDWEVRATAGGLFLSQPHLFPFNVAGVSIPRIGESQRFGVLLSTEERETAGQVLCSLASFLDCVGTHLLDGRSPVEAVHDALGWSPE